MNQSVRENIITKICMVAVAAFGISVTAASLSPVHANVEGMDLSYIEGCMRAQSEAEEFLNSRRDDIQKSVEKLFSDHGTKSDSIALKVNVGFFCSVTMAVVVKTPMAQFSCKMPVPQDSHAKQIKTKLYGCSAVAAKAVSEELLLP